LSVPDPWNGPGIETVGFLEDLEPVYARSRGMLAPIIGGSGVRVKLLESLRAGIPVVTTSDGALGLPLEDGKEALISSDPKALPSASSVWSKTTPCRSASARAATLTSSHNTRSRSRNG
jgi:glycosyltransferase involved in cell wall biosynthesis